MKEILEAAHEQGLNPGPLEFDGKIKRFPVSVDDKRKSGWIVGWQNHTLKSGEVFYVATFGNFRTGEVFKFHNLNVKFSMADRKIIRDQMEKAAKIEKDQRLIEQIETSKEAEIEWNNLSPVGESEYLVRKKIHDCQNLDIRYSKLFVAVALKDIAGKIWSLQKIFSNGEKRLYSGGKKSENFSVIGNLETAQTVRLTEGLATGATIHMASGDCVVVAFDSGNLVTVSKLLKAHYPEKIFIVCADDDKFKEVNVGREKGTEASKLSLGSAIFPIFKSLEGEPTDWNDLHCREGLDEVKKQLRAVKVPLMALYALGYKEKEYFFTSTANHQIIAVTTFTETDFLHLMPLEYWEAVYPGKGEKSRVDWSLAKSSLMEKCRARGLFDNMRIRGSGAWIDDDRIVVNLGEYLLVDGVRTGLGEIRSKYFYSLGKSLAEFSNSPLSVEECKHLIDACSNFKWIKSDSGIVLAGALALQRVCGALPVRPHIWLTGGAQTGKSTLLERLISKIIGDTGLYVQGTTTEAGVRQSLKSNAIPVLFDEFETNGSKADENITAIIELCRAAWSDSSADIIKGGASGNASRYKVRFCAIVSSIRTKLNNDADKGRFSILELAPHGDDQDHWKKLSDYLTGIDELYAERLFSRVTKLLPVLLHNFKTFRKILALKGGARFGDQYGMLLAGYSVLLQDEPIELVDAENLANQIESNDDKAADHNDCLEHLISSTTKDGSKVLIQEALCRVTDSSDDGYFQNILFRHGLAVKKNELFVANNSHSELSKIFRDTKWADWSPSLRRLEGARAGKTMIMKREQRGTFIPLKLIISEKP
jgi:putative DNA primase/helicase